MRTATFTLALFVALGYAATAQKFSLLPQVGIENFRTTLRYNDLSSFAPLGGLLSPHLGLRLDYRFKQGHGPYVGIATSRSVATFSFSDPETGMNDYKAAAGNLRLRFEGGYQFTTKPIYFNKAGSSNKSSKLQNKSSVIHTESRCGAAARYHCGKNMEKAIAARSKNRGWNVRIQPSLGIAFTPAIHPGVTMPDNNQGTYKYQAGNWNSALVAGTGFEFGKNRQRMFTLSINYLKGIGNLDTRTINSISGAKTIVTQLKSNTSGWNITAGIPISLNKKKPFTQSKIYERSQKSEGGCGQYRMRCRKVI